MKYFEDFPVGFSLTTSTVTLSEADIIAFAREHDPQPFHIDPEAAADTVYGGVIASGFQTLIAGFKLWLAEGGWAEASMGSPGLDELRWLRPVRPGAVLRMTATVVASRPSSKSADRGYTTVDHVISDETGAAVMTYRGVHMLKRRPS